MIKYTFILLIGLFSLTILAQDTIQKPIFPFRPYFENGIDFIRNDYLKENYETQSKYFYGFGIQMGHPKIHNLIPYFQYTYSSFAIEKDITTNIKADSSLTIQQISGGFLIPLKKTDIYIFRIRLGYSFSMITESFNDISSNSNGFQVGIGTERKIFRNSRVYIDLIYNYQKTTNSTFKDFDMTKLAFGFIL